MSSTPAAAAGGTSSFAAAHYPLQALDMNIHVLNACSAYVNVLKQIITSANSSDLAVLVSKDAAKAAKENAASSSKQQQDEESKNKSSGGGGGGGVVPSYFDLFSPSITTSSQHIPHGSMKRISLFKYLTPSGIKVISAEGVNRTLTAARMPYVTDLIGKASPPSSSSSAKSSSSSAAKSSSSSSSAAAAQQQSNSTAAATTAAEDEEGAMYEQLRELPYLELDTARFCLCVMWDLAERGVFDVRNESSTLTPLAKRDMKKALNVAASAGAKAAIAGGGDDDEQDDKTAQNNKDNSKSVVGQGTAKGPRVQKNLRALLEEECAVAWPHTPIEKAVVFTVVNDPSQPRHRPKFKATIEFPLLKKMKVEGDWEATKRDAENAAADKSLLQVRRLLKK